MTTALVTGGTAGLGHGFARALAKEGHDLVLVARTADRLAAVAEEITAEYDVEVATMVADLSERDQVDAVAERVASESEPIGILVNNAGFGLNQAFVGGSLAGEQRLIDVLVVAPMRLCHAAAGAMVARGTGSIINVSSVAGWITGGTYSAAKAWATTFTEGLAGELAGTGVTATAVCPGFVHTEFHERADLDMSGIPGIMWLDVDQVVDQAIKDAKRGRVISVAGNQYQLLSLAAQYAPRPLVRRAVRARGR